MLTIASLAACVSQASGPALPVYTCPKAAVPPAIDGRLDDEAWQLAPEIPFVNATNGAPITKPTKARMCWDDSCLYICWECADTDIWGTMTNRDDPIYQQEVVEAFLCPTCDLVHYFEFNVSPRNVIFDAAIVNPTGDSPNDQTSFAWNCEGLRSAVVVDGTLDDRTDVDRGWTAELAIPFAGLGIPAPKPGQRWRANLYRIDLDPKPSEFQAWSPTLYTSPRFHVPARFGTIFFSEAAKVE